MNLDEPRSCIYKIDLRLDLQLAHKELHYLREVISSIASGIVPSACNVSGPLPAVTIGLVRLSHVTKPSVSFYAPI